MGLSFEEMFEAEFDALHGYLARRIGSAADDLTAEVFATAYRRWRDFDPSRPARPWLYGIAANLMRHHWRTERRMLLAYARSGVDSQSLENHDSDERLTRAERSALAAALSDLASDELEVLLLHAWAQFSDREIADALSVPLGTVKSRMSRARERMRNRLTGSGKVESEYASPDR